MKFTEITQAQATAMGLDRHAKYGFETQDSELKASVHMAGYYTVTELESMIAHLREVETAIFEHAMGVRRSSGWNKIPFPAG